jgi:hypothetical protein
MFWEIIGIIALILMIVGNIFFFVCQIKGHGILTGTDDE